MKALFRCGLFVVLIFFGAGVLHPNDYKSVVIQGGGTPVSISVDDSRFLVIRTFTQQNGTLRGAVTVTMLNGQTSLNQNVLSASIMPTTTGTIIEPVNSVVIAGPATVLVTCPDTSATCFVSYRKESGP